MYDYEKTDIEIKIKKDEDNNEYELDILMDVILQKPLDKIKCYIEVE